MSAAPAFPVRLPDPARRPFADSHLAQRLVQVAQLPAEARVLGLGGGSNSLAWTLALDYRIEALIAVPDESARELEQARIREAGVEDRVQARAVDISRLPFRDGEFHLAIAESQLWLPPEKLLPMLRRHLAPSEGRLAFTWPVHVGRGAPASNGAWTEGTGAPLLLPRELLGLMAAQGYEPEDALTLDRAQLEAIYRDWAALPEDAPGDPIFRREALRQLEDSRPLTATWGLMVGRRQEPGERPYQTHDRG